MTFKSLNVEKHSSYESAHAEYVVGANHEVYISLNAFTFPISAQSFAKEKKLEIRYVDNAWARIAVKGKVLKQFVALDQETERGLTAQLNKVNDEHWFVINEEEF